jgi:protein phosphatase 2C family protein 2/3
MEDSHSVHLFLPLPGEAPAVPSNEEIPEQPAGSTVTNDSKGVDGNALFGVFDGHGGSTVAKFTGTSLHKRLIELDSYSAWSAFVQGVSADRQRTGTTRRR